MNNNIHKYLDIGIFILALTFLSPQAINEIKHDLYLNQKYFSINTSATFKLTSVVISSKRINYSHTISRFTKFDESGFFIKNAKSINSESSELSDSTIDVKKKGNESDFYYYVLGILILIAAGIILKKRYEDYLKEKNSFNK